MGIKIIIPFVEGKGDIDAVPILMRRVRPVAQPAKIDVPPIKITAAWRVGHLQHLVKNDGKMWKDKLAFASSKRRASGVLLLLDGDRLPLGGQDPLCPANIAQALVNQAKMVGAGACFSVAVVIAMQEVESWFIAGASSLIRARQSQGKQDATAELEGDLEKHPRDAKAWLSHYLPGGYSPTLHQADCAARVDLDQIRDRKMRSFARFEKAVHELFDAVIMDRHIATPVPTTAKR